ncbi:MAG: dTMP kinase [Thermodesulfobacteriota bacterium]|jgi:dTMP kinase
MAGFFISFEGIEGSGKSTQAALLAEALRAQGRGVVVTREPGGTPLGQTLRRLLLEPVGTSLAPRAELLLMLADRAQHIQEVIAPGLRGGKVVISDRFVDSTTAYQGYGRGIAPDLLAQLNAFTCDGYLPALTLLLDLPVPEGLRRAGQRRGRATGTDPFEAESLDFHERVRAGFLEVARTNPTRVCVIDAARPREEIHQEILAIVQARLGEKAPPATGPG